MTKSFAFFIYLFGMATSQGHGQNVMQAVMERIMAAGRPDADTPKAGTEADVGASELVWRSRQSLPGQSLGYRDKVLVWQTPFLEGPAKLSEEALLLWQAPQSTAISAEEDVWQVRLKNGDVLRAKGIEQREGGVLLKSKSSGEVAVGVEHLHSAIRCKGERVIYAGPQGGVGWRSNGYFPVAGAGLATQRWNALAEMSLTLPEKVTMRVVLRSVSELQFVLTLGDKEGSHPSLEMWGRDLVLVIRVGEEMRYCPVMVLEEDQRAVILTLGWDRVAREARVWDDHGKELAVLRVESPDKPNKAKDDAISLKNLGANLILEELVLRPWDGKTPPPSTAALAKPGGVIDWMAADEVRWSADSFAYTTAPTRPRALWWDGSCVTGLLEQMTEEKITLKPDWAAASVSRPVSGLWRLFFGNAPDAEPDKTADVLSVGELQVRGQVEGAAGATGPLWRLPGAVEAVRVSAVGKPTVQMQTTKAVPVSGALLFLSNGDVVRSELRGLGDDKLQIELPHFEQREVPVSDVRALHWSVSGGEILGFRDPAWQKSQSGKVTLGDTPDADSIRLGAGVSLGHPRVAIAGGIELAVEAEDGWGGVELSLFAAEIEGTNKDAFVLNVFFSGDQVYAQAKGHQRGQTSGQSVRESGDSVKIKVWRAKDLIKVSCNGTPLLSAAIDKNKTQGEGLILRAGSMWGNTVRPVTVTGFRAAPKAGELPVLNASATAKAEALTIPRFRRDVLPKHLLVANNGDVVRGRIEAITGDSLRFTSGIETLDVARSRVRAIVWPQLPDTKPAGPRTGDGLWLTLHDGSAFALTVTEFGKTEVTGKSGMLGPCRVPLYAISSVAWSAAELGPAVKSHLEWPMSYAPEPVLPEKEESPLLGKVAPGFKLPLLYEGDFKLEEKKGQVVVLDFWASWCGPCVRSMPDLLELAGEYEEKAVYFLAINQSEPAALVKRFIETRGWKLNVALDGLGGTGLKYGVEGIPHTVVIDAAGNVSAVFVGAGPDSKTKLKAAIDAALAKRKTP